jgi:hypothetical protein
MIRFGIAKWKAAQALVWRIRSRFWCRKAAGRHWLERVGTRPWTPALSRQAAVGHSETFVGAAEMQRFADQA